MGTFNVFICCLIGLTMASPEENSPVLLWSPERSMVDFPDVSSVDSFAASDFYDQYLSPLMHRGQENAVIFLQDKLSVEDFTKYADVYSIDSQGGAFKNVKHLMEDHFSLEVPQVVSPLTAVETLKRKFDGQVHTVEDLSQLKDLGLGGGKRFLLIVTLRPVIGAEDEKKAITENDALVGDVTSYLRSRDIKYSALFTGKSGQMSNEAPEPADSNQHSNRHLMAADDKSSSGNCTFMNVTNSDIYVYLCGVKVCIVDKSDTKKCAVSLNMTTSAKDADASTKHNNTAQVILNYNDVEDSQGTGNYNVKLVMDVVLKMDRWVMERNSLYVTEAKSTTGNVTKIDNATLTNSDLDTVIPRLYSFHCTKLKLFVETVHDTTYKDFAGSFITLEGFQVQVFDIANNRFFYAQDCVGFFSAGIWMGILPGLLLIGILVYGTMMVLNLSVMDKFDDPKGKTITVNVAES